MQILLKNQRRTSNEIAIYSDQNQMYQCQMQNQANDSTCLQNKVAILYTDIHEIDKINFEIGKIGSEILRITLMVKQRNIKDINKNFQATLTNYFLECYVCTLLLKHTGLQYKREVKKLVESKLTLQQSVVQNDDGAQSPILNHNNYQIMNNNCFEQSQCKNNEETENKIVSKQQNETKANRKVAKYILLIKVYEEQINTHQLSEQYIDMLIKKINENIDCFSKDSQKYITEYQKKLCAVLLLQHFIKTNTGNKFNSFCELWNSVFISLPLYYFARENNIFYNKIKMGEETSSSHQYLNQILSSTDIKIKIQENVNSQQIKVSSNQQTSQKKHAKIANYKQINQNPPIINLNYSQIANQHYQKQNQLQKDKNQIFQEKIEQEENLKKGQKQNDDYDFGFTANEIRIVNFFRDTQPNKRREKLKRKLKQEDSDQAMNLLDKKQKALKRNNSFYSSQLQKSDSLNNQQKNFLIDIQSNSKSLPNSSQIDEIENNKQDDKNIIKQAKYRFI